MPIKTTVTTRSQKPTGSTSPTGPKIPVRPKIKDPNQKLIDCYSDQAEHFGNTREKARPEFTYLMQAIELYQSDHLTPKGDLQECSVLDMWCGTGRFYNSLKENTFLNIDYTGVDIAPGMITQAKKIYPIGKWVVDEMLHYMSGVEQESVDIIVGIASVQHLMSPKQRQQFFSQVYRALKRDWIFLMVNRSYSSRFLQRYRRQQLCAWARSLVAPRRWRNDLMIPRKDPDYKNNHKKFHRHYHMFTLYELQQLARLGWFIVAQQGYVQQDWTLTDIGWKGARNTRMRMEKKVVN